MIINLVLLQILILLLTDDAGLCAVDCTKMSNKDKSMMASRDIMQNKLKYLPCNRHEKKSQSLSMPIEFTITHAARDLLVLTFAVVARLDHTE